MRKSVGFNWGPAAVSTSYWTGVRLCDLLAHCGVHKTSAGARYVCFRGVQKELPQACCFLAGLAQSVTLQHSWLHNWSEAAVKCVPGGLELYHAFQEGWNSKVLLALLFNRNMPLLSLWSVPLTCSRRAAACMQDCQHSSSMTVSAGQGWLVRDIAGAGHSAGPRLRRNARIQAERPPFGARPREPMSGSLVLRRFRRWFGSGKLLLFVIAPRWVLPCDCPAGKHM